MCKLKVFRKIYLLKDSRIVPIVMHANIVRVKDNDALNDMLDTKRYLPLSLSLSLKTEYSYFEILIL